MTDEQFTPDWASAPGGTILQILQQRRMSLADFARSMGSSVDGAIDLTQGVTTITKQIASTLETVLGPSTGFWMNRERQYRNDLSRLAPTFSVAGYQSWLSQLPISDMVRFGWIKASRSPAQRLKACLEFFSVSDIAAWYTKFRSPLLVAAFRTSPTYESNPASVSAWLRWAEIKSSKIECKKWDKQKFEAALEHVRALTRRNEPSKFLPELKRICAECGVAVVIARAPKGCRASGATRFLSTEKAMIVLSFRYRSDDQFWFTFFHEAGHLVLHGKEALFLEDGSEVTSEEEHEANDFAAKVMIPPVYADEFSNLRPQMREIILFARSIGIAPGLVVGQLQHARMLRPDRLNGLKRHYSWAALESGGFNL
jgi:HTH-type transcriptional regulator/antitoxin HigA